MYKGLVLLAILASLLTACKDTAPKSGDLLDENYEPIVPAATTQNTPPAAATPPVEPPQNDKGIWHYTCPKGCKGGAGKADPCANCGTTLVHNTVYHDGGTPGTPPPITQPTIKTVNNNNKAASSQNAGIGTISNPIMKGVGFTQPDPASGITIPTEKRPGGLGANTPKAPEPPQNAAGVWHYTCNAGCAGGAGSAVACASCGKTLVHNTVYHNK